MLRSAGLAVKALVPPSISPAEAQDHEIPGIERQKQDFSAAATEYFKRLYSIDVGLRTQIRALEADNIIATEATSKDQASSTALRSNVALLGEPRTLATSNTAGKSAVSGGGLGSLDVGWLNSRNDYVGKNMEAEWLRKASEFLADLEARAEQKSAGAELEAMDVK